jgi:hypothetical protein
VTRNAARAVTFLFTFLLVTPAFTAPRFGVQGGIVGARITSDIDPDHVKYRPSWSAGVDALLPMGPIQLATGVRYIEYGEAFDLEFEITNGSEVSSFSFRDHQVWQYLSLPLIARYAPSRAHGMFLGVGPEVGYLANVKLTLTENGSETTFHAQAPHGRREGVRMAQIFEDIGTFDPTQLYERWNVSACASIGWTLPVSVHQSEFEFRYTHGLTDILKSSEFERRTRAVEMLGTVRW